MKRLLCSAFILFTSNAFASLITTIDHQYGSGTYVPTIMAVNSCDTQNANNITVKDTASGCQRFVDVFSFAAFNLANVDYFQLDLTFSGTNNNQCFFVFCDNENWLVRPAVSATTATDINMQSLIKSTGITSQSFIFNSSNLADIFAQIVISKQFYLWFAETSVGNDQFTLYSANLLINGSLALPVLQATPAASEPTAVADPAPASVPAPASLALFGLGLLMLRRFKK